MGTDTLDGSSKQGLGKWYRADSLGLGGDTDWYKLGGTLIPTNSDSAYRSGYTLLKGLYGGLATKIEMLKDGVLQFDIADGATDQNFIRFKPLQDGTRNVDFLMSTTTTPFSGSRNDNVFYWGWNLGAGGGVVESGKGAIGLSMEDFYNPSGTNAYAEFHLIHYDTLGNSRRPMTFLLDVGNTTTWATAFSVNKMSFTMAHDIADVGFEFTMPDSIRSLFKMMNPATGLGVEMLTNDASNEFQISNTMGSGGTIFLNSFEYTEAKRLRRQTSMGTTGTTIAGNDGSGWFTNIGTGWGIDLTSGNLVVDSSQVATVYDLTTITGDDWGADVVNHDLTLTGNGTVGTPLGVDTSEIATQYDLTLISSGATDLTIGGSGPTYTIESSTGTDVTIEANPGLYLTESPANNLVISNDGVVSGANSSAATTHTLELLDWTGGVALGSLQLAEGTGVTLTTTGTTSNGIVTIASTVTDTDTRVSVDEDDVLVESNAVTINFSTGLDAQESPSTQVNVNLDFGEFPQDAVLDGDEEVLVWDTGASIEERVPVAQFDQSTTNEIQDITVTGGSQPFTLDLGSDATDATFTGAGITTVTRSGNAMTFTSTEVDGSTTNEAWTIDGDIGSVPELITTQTVLFTGAGGIQTDWDGVNNELIIDASGVTGTGDGNGIYDGDGTVPANTDILLTDGNTRMYGTAAALKIEDTNGSGSPTLTLEGNVEDADAPMGTILFQYTDTDFATDQAAWTIVGTRETDSQEHSTLEVTANEAASSPPILTWEENENLSDNTQETNTRINSGVAFTQSWESASSNAITLDRAFYNVVLNSGHTGTISLPEIYGVDESNIEINAAQVPVGQEYVISNYSGSGVTLAAFNGTSTNDDYLNNTIAGTITLSNNKSYIIKAIRLNGTQGYWSYWISD
jgi:hypothetical protein